MSRTPKLVIAMDGPSGSGKSSTSRLVASELGCAYLNTGAMYRALAQWCHSHDIEPTQHSAVIDAAQRMPMRIVTDPNQDRVFLADEDVTEQLHSPEVSGIVSGYANIRPARDILTAMMRDVIEQEGRIVVEGRDITTVVAPDADVKVLLQADLEARVARRDKQFAGALGSHELHQQVAGRDKLDAKSSQFQQATDGVVLIDSTFLDLDQVVEAVISLVPAGLRDPA